MIAEVSTCIYYAKPNRREGKSCVTFTVDSTRIACLACHSVRSCRTFETVGTSDIGASSVKNAKLHISTYYNFGKLQQHDNLNCTSDVF